MKILFTKKINNIYLEQSIRDIHMGKEPFEQIFKTYYSDIYNFIWHYVMDQEDAKDLTQDTFISFYNKYPSLPEDTNPKQYLLTIVKNHSVSFLRHKQVTDRHQVKYFESVVFSATTEYDTTYDELLDQLDLAMESLSDLQKQIISMKLEGKNYSEISDKLHITPSQVHKNVKRAYAKIREQMDKPENKAICGLLAYFLTLIA